MVPVDKRNEVLYYINCPWKVPKNLKKYSSRKSSLKIEEMIKEYFNIKKESINEATFNLIKRFGELHLWKGINSVCYSYCSSFDSFDVAFSYAVYYSNKQLEFDF